MSTQSIPHHIFCPALDARGGSDLFRGTTIAAGSWGCLDHGGNQHWWNKRQSHLWVESLLLPSHPLEYLEQSPDVRSYTRGLRRENPRVGSLRAAGPGLGSPRFRAADLFSIDWGDLSTALLADCSCGFHSGIPSMHCNGTTKASLGLIRSENPNKIQFCSDFGHGRKP